MRVLKIRSDLIKNRVLYRCLETNRYLCTIIQNKNGHQQAKSGVDRRSTSLFGCVAIQSSAEDILQHLQG